MENNESIASEMKELKQKSNKPPGSSVVSLKSEATMDLQKKLSASLTCTHLLESEREPSVVSLKSEASMGLPPKLSDGSVTYESLSARQRRAHSGLSVVSLKSEASMGLPPKLCDGSRSSESLSARQKGVYPEPSVVSLKSEASMGLPPKLCDGSVTSESLSTMTACVEQDLYKPANDVLQRVKEKHKTSMKNKYECLFEGIKLQENQTLLNRIYTQLYIIEGESEGVNVEHEVLHMEKKPRATQHAQDTPIYCNDIFKALPKAQNQTEKIKMVLTKGIAGIGKTVSVQKFILDWTEGSANQAVDFMFVLPFRELNLIRDDPYSLHKLLLDFYPELQDLDSKIFDYCTVVFIFDGLDESRMTLMFTDNEKVFDVTETSSVGVLMSNLMKGDLLPSALIWITSRPAAASQIPSKYITRVTEIQGFNDTQKEIYFRKRISDEHEASRIISHIRRARSLYIMCHIPVFCWISSTVLQSILKQDNERADIPQTLTEMYMHFLLIQINMKNQKYDERDPEKLLHFNREVIVKLAEVAFKQLMKGNVMFYEDELKECGIDITDASLYSGICTEIFKEEPVIHQRKIYSFIHLSFQEFLAAFFVFYCYSIKNIESLRLILEAKCNYFKFLSEQHSLSQLLETAVDKALQSQTGHLDLFLRFLLGISLESNHRVLQDLLTRTHSSLETINKISLYIKDKIKYDDLSADRSISLFLCLLEVNDQTLYREIEEFVRSDNSSEKTLSVAHCSAIAYMLQMSEEVMEEFNLKKYNTTEEGRRRLMPAVINCRKALNDDLQDSGVKLICEALKGHSSQLHTLRLSRCSLTGECCESLSTCVKSLNSLRDLDLSNNDLQDSGVKLISDALKNHNCQLHTLRLSSCNLMAECCEGLFSYLQSSNSMRDLDLSNNDLQDCGVKLISDALKSNSQLHTLRLSGCMVTYEGCCYLASALCLNPSHLRELDLSYNHPEDSGLQLLTDILNDPYYTLNKLNIDHGGQFRVTAGPRKWACDVTLDPNTVHSHLILSENNRKVTSVKIPQPYPDHPERFDEDPQVLCRESLTGHCYWEAEWSGREAVISVAYKSIRRKGKESQESVLGYNIKSWALECTDNKFTTRHDRSSTVLSVCPLGSKRVGVYVDWSVGTLSFYSISNTHVLTHLHTFNTTFTEPLYAGFMAYDSSVSLCDMY